MKRMAGVNLLVGMLLILTSMPCFGLEEIADHDLQAVCGQSGVGILLDHNYYYIKIDQTSFQDPDGLLSVNSDQAALNLNGLEIDVFREEAIAPTDPENPDKGIYDTEDFHCPYDAYFKTGDSKAVPAFYGSILTFDVLDRLPVMSAASNYLASGNPLATTSNVAGLNIGLPTIELYLTETDLQSITMSSAESSLYNAGKSYGHFYMKGLQLDLLDGTLEVAPHNSCGLDIAIDDIALYGKMDTFTYYYEDTPDETNVQYRITDLLIDAIHVNALTDLDANGQPHSPGNNVFLKAGSQHGVCNALQVDNYNFSTGKWKDRFFSIDLTSALPAMSAIARTRNVAGISIGLPALEFYMDSMEYVSTLGDHDGELLGKWTRTGMEITTLEGRIEIAPHNAYGMDIALDDVVAYTSIARLSYVDIDDNAEYCINNLEQDTLNINAITLDASGNLISPGDHGLHFTHLTAAHAPAGFTPSPITIDLSGRLPLMSSSAGHTMAGVSIGLPTMEIYCEESGIGSITLHDLDNTASNNNAPFFTNIRYQNEKHAFLGGTVEIAPH